MEIFHQKIFLVIYPPPKLYFIMVITGSVVLTIAGVGRWLISDIINNTSGWIGSEKLGLLAIPTSGWEYADGGKFVGDDETIKFI